MVLAVAAVAAAAVAAEVVARAEEKAADGDTQVLERLQALQRLMPVPHVGSESLHE